MDTKNWDRDPIMLEVGASPGDIVELPDGTVVTATTVGHRVARFGLPSGRVLGDIVLPMTTGQLFLVRSAGRPYLAVLGALTHDRRPEGAWIDLFDPEETPFGATRRSIPVGRDLRAGSVSTDGSAVLLPDFASNSASLLRLRGETEARSVEVGQGPISAYLMNGDRFGLTLNQRSSSATVIPLSSFQPSSIILPGIPRTAALSPDRSTLFVALGGPDSPPRDDGLAILGGEPPDLVATLPTGKGAIAVATSPDGNRAAVASYHDRIITIAE
jgi:hypothetical protein